MRTLGLALLLTGLSSQVSLAADVTAQTASQGSVTTAGSLFSVLFGLIAVIAMIVGLAWMARRIGVTRHQENALIQVVGSTSLGARERVAIVQVQDSWIVVGISPAGLSSLATLPRGHVEQSSGFASPAGFAGKLKVMLEARAKNAQ
ncbi:MAG: flagellar biosynthetic protein FliO [Hydrogenophilaceae bacterium]|nr:flagellar biosynthetic protein FliO [Hydrogenophilaceae bacterium]